MTALVNTLSLWQNCQMARASIGPCRMTSGPAPKKSPSVSEKITLKAGAGEPALKARTRRGAGFFVLLD